MDLSNKVLAQRIVYSPMSRQPGLVCKRTGANPDMEMAFPAVLITAVMTVTLAIIAYQKFTWRKRLPQAGFDLLSPGHFFRSTPVSF